MNKSLVIKIIGTVATAIGMGATLILGWVKDEETDKKIEEKVNEALSKTKD